MANCVKCGRKLPSFSFGKKICSWCVQHEAAQRGLEPEEAVQRVEPAPWLRRQSNSMLVTQILLGINVAVFIAMVLADASALDHPSGELLVGLGANYGPLTLGGEWWRLLTCVFIHGSLLHIAFNMWSLWNIGSIAESLYGRWTFAALYLLAGIGGSLGSLIWNPNVLSVGASGAIFGIVGALISSFYLGEFSMRGQITGGTMTSLLIFSAYSLAQGATSSGIDNGAHVGGLVSGLILGALIARGAPDPDKPIRRVAVLAFAIVLIGGGAGWWFHSRDYMRHMKRGVGFLAGGKTDQAVNEFQTVIGQRPEFAAAHFALARSYAIKGDLAHAETEFKRVLELNPENENSFYNLGFVYIEEAKLPEARAAFQQLIAINPNSANGHFGLAAVAMEEKKYQDAIQESQAAARLNPDLEGVYYNQGRAQAKLGLYDDAIGSFKKELEKMGDDHNTEIALANTYEAKGMKKEAAETRAKAAELTGKN
jgi:membrane associated rhomboid family serine protease/Tfp pilus assembly protein PilF